MDYTHELVKALRAGETIKLVLTPNEPVRNAYVLFNRLRNLHGLEVERQAVVENGKRAYIIWCPAHRKADA